jgi:hypothetical protein
MVGMGRGLLLAGLHEDGRGSDSAPKKHVVVLVADHE